MYTENSAEDLSIWQQDITKRLDTLEKQHATSERNFAAWQDQVKGMHSQPAKTLEEPLVVYSLAYPEQGRRKIKAGICPDSRASEWLNEFKAAVVEYSRDSQDGPRLQLEVRGLSGVAQVTEAACRNRSDQCNCDIANERAEAVVGFLTSDDSCTDVLNEQRWESPGNDPCLRPKKEFKLSTQHGFDVIYRPWQSYEEMMRHKPINDGSSDGKRRPAVEFLRRAVQIMVKKLHAK